MIYLTTGNTVITLLRKSSQEWHASQYHLPDVVTAICSDPLIPGTAFCAVKGSGFWITSDGGRSWQWIGNLTSVYSGEKPIRYISALAVSPLEREVIYAGTDPSAMFKSENFGRSWVELTSFRDLPSAPTWSFPPEPSTSHIKWIEPDPIVYGRVFVAVEAGALVRTIDGGHTWEDRLPDSPYDSHTLATHPLAPHKLYSAAGDGVSNPGRGYSESMDAGLTWQRPNEGLEHHYLWGLAVDSGNPDIVVVSGASTPWKAHNIGVAESFIYRREKDSPWQKVTQGLPPITGTIVWRLVADVSRAGTFYALSNKGLYMSEDTGLSWRQIRLSSSIKPTEPLGIAVGPDEK